MRGGKSLEAKLSLAQTFVELAETMPIDDITVNMIVDRLGKHRKTFYYHFPSKSYLVVWLFRYELARELEKTFAPDQLVFEGADGMFPEFAYYARNIDENTRIYNAPFFDGLYSCFERRRAYYRNVFSQLGPGTLEHYLLSLYMPAIADDIRYLMDRKISEQKLMVREDIRIRVDRGYSVDFLAEFFTGAFVSRYIQRLNYASVGRTAQEISPFENVIHDSLGWLIHQEVTRHALEG
ncbi:MAG: TetR family transcriptional regulator [Eggerthellaceae bacterium]|nr:TetR family transcriptional regulator [Eggerthellaceae bacterium]